MITTAKFQGHGAAVLCLDVSATKTSTATTTPALLLSGSEDGTARLWDLRDHRRHACLCIRVPNGGDVLSAVFAPKLEREGKEAEPPTTPFAKDCSVFLGVENTVLEYDLRHSDSPIVSSEPTRDWGKVLQNQDEVNQIDLVYYNNSKNNVNGNTNNHGSKKKKKKGGGNKKKQQQQPSSSGETNTGNNSLYLVACDDAGKARWTEAWSLSSLGESETNNASENNSNCNHNHTSSTILHHDSHGVAVVPTCAFRPSSYKRGGGGGASLELATGGTDCKIQLWDVFRPKKPLSTFTINQNNTNEEGQSKPQVCNPPFVYSLAWSYDGTSLAAGLGDGTVGVFEINNRTLVQSQLLVGSSNDGNNDIVHFAHESSVASVVYPSFSASTSDRVLCSAGSDGGIVFWDLGKPNDEQWDDIIESTTGEKTANNKNSDDAVAQLFPPPLLQGLCGETHNPAAERKNSTKPRMLFRIPHGEKINWVTSATQLETASSHINDTVFVADTSSDITSYTIPF